MRTQEHTTGGRTTHTRAFQRVENERRKKIRKNN